MSLGLEELKPYGRRRTLLFSYVPFLWICAYIFCGIREVDANPATENSAPKVAGETSPPAEEIGAPTSEDTELGKELDPNLPPALRARCEAVGLAIVKGVTYLENHEPSSIDSTFIVTQLHMQAKRQALADFIQKARVKFEKDPSIWYLTRGSSRLTIPEPLPKGEDLLKLITNTPQADPPQASFDLLVKFLAAQHNGYLLTHQMFMLEIAKSRGAEIPLTIKRDGSQYLVPILEEHKKSKDFGYLYARRTLLLLLYSLEIEPVASEWVEVLLAAQREDGSWHDDRVVSSELEGASFSFVPSDVDTTAYATYCLAVFLRKYCDPEAEVDVN